MLLAVDIGNTNICVGVYDGQQLLIHWRISTDRRKTADEFGMLLKQMFYFDNMDIRQISDAAISSVVPPLTPVWDQTVRKYAGVTPLVIGPGVRSGMDLKYDSPRDVGADRIVGAVAAYQKYSGPCIVVDFGTATTFDAISKNGVYQGGAIAPGIGISTEALFQHAAKLPRIEITTPKTVIGHNTVAAMQAGIVFGYAGQVEYIVKKMKEELGGQAYVVATGGLAQQIASETRVIDKVDPMLVLEGIRIVWERNQQA